MTDTPTPAQQLDVAVELIEIANDSDDNRDLDVADDVARSFIQANAPLLRRALAALEAVESAEDCMCGDCSGDGVWHIEPCGYCGGHGNFKMVPAPKSPADAVEVSRG